MFKNAKEGNGRILMIKKIKYLYCPSLHQVTLLKSVDEFIDITSDIIICAVKEKTNIFLTKNIIT